mgnify:CR=1 FL=1
MRLRASYTIENSVIIPLFTIIMVVLVSLCFYLHDSVILKNTVFQTALKYESLQEQKQDSMVLQQSVSDYLTDKTLLLHDIRVELSSNNGSYVVNAQAQVRHLSFMKDMALLNREAEVKAQKSADFIRLVEAAFMVKDRIANK